MERAATMTGSMEMRTSVWDFRSSSTWKSLSDFQVLEDLKSRTLVRISIDPVIVAALSIFVLEQHLFLQGSIDYESSTEIETCRHSGEETWVVVPVVQS